ncbi:SAM-dependent methyltransferase [Allorhizocola rhizosphaerae]|uniref:SAM-dependent methyltransferase n=1 Tax=Allorhizocola rhizosphaerae TaxID=1872709 RepID=UPI001FEC148A|nr:methyltransferase domain-containing protein [Allorhizocola rhizosphaerae]
MATDQKWKVNVTRAPDATRAVPVEWAAMTPETDVDQLTARVRRYYDRNAAAFERLGQGGASIHRAVWGPGVTTRSAAFHHVDELILDSLPPDIARPTVVDLGCGLGASLLYLAGRTDMRGEGITLSPAQAARATRLIAEAGAGSRVRCREGNYLAVPDDLAGIADLTFSIEAFIHSPDPDLYFQQAARTLRPGGKLVLCDDFLTSSSPPGTARGTRLLREFRAGWHASSLLTVEQVRTLAAKHGLTMSRDLDLTAHLELRRPRDRWVSLLLALGRPLRPSGEYWQSLVGGNALQHALLEGLLSYRFLVLMSK